MSTSEAGGAPPTQPAFSGLPPRPPKITARAIEDQPDDPGRIIFVPDPVEVMELAVKLGVKPFKLVAAFLELGQFIYPEEWVDFETTAIIAEKLGYRAFRLTPEFPS